MIRFLEHRIGDKRLIRLITKWLNAGVMEGTDWTDTGRGVPQGAIVSPVPANAYLETTANVVHEIGGALVTDGAMQARAFQLQPGIRGEVRLVERAFGIGPDMKSELMSLHGAELERIAVQQGF